MDHIISVFSKIKKNPVYILMTMIFLTIIYLVISNFRGNNLNSEVFSQKASDSFVLVDKWSVIVKRWDSVKQLWLKERFWLSLWDKVKTLSDSNANIFWPDWSVTRLWEKTSVTITELKAKEDLSSFKIKFNIEQWKTWSNVIKYITKDSDFTETYDAWRYAATVRWTVFEINVDDEYVHSVSHNITLTDENEKKSYNIPEGTARSLHNISYFVPEYFLDSNWINENLAADKNLINLMAKAWTEKVSRLIKDSDIWIAVVSYMKQTLWSEKETAISKIKDFISSWNMSDLWTLKTLASSYDNDSKWLNKLFLDFYQNIWSLPNTDENVLIKSNIRWLIIKTADPESRQKLMEDFLRLDIFEYVQKINEWSDETAKVLKNNIDWYLKWMQDPKVLKTLLWSFSEDMLWVVSIWFDSLKDEINKIIQSDDLKQIMIQ